MDLTLQKIPPTYHVFRQEMEQMSYTWAFLVSWGPTKYAWQVLHKMYILFLMIPMYYLYMKGPSFGGYGFWSGKSAPDICSTITSVDSHFWTSSTEKMQECELIILREFDSFMTGIMSLVYLFVLGKMICWFVTGIQKTSVHAYQTMIQTIRQSHSSNHKNGEQSERIVEERIVITDGNLRRSLRRSISKEKNGLSSSKEDFRMIKLET